MRLALNTPRARLRRLDQEEESIWPQAQLGNEEGRCDRSVCALRTQANLYLFSRTAGTRVTSAKLALYNVSSYARSIGKEKRQIREEGSAILI